MGKPTYVGVFLGRASRDILLARLGARHPNVFCDHLTLAFGKAMGETQYPIGQSVPLLVHEVVEDDKGQAVRCDVHVDFKKFVSDGQTPHITISCANGVAPKYSNELLQKQDAKRSLNHLIEIEGVLDYFPRTIQEEGSWPKGNLSVLSANRVEGPASTAVSPNQKEQA